MTGQTATGQTLTAKAASGTTINGQEANDDGRVRFTSQGIFALRRLNRPDTRVAVLIVALITLLTASSWNASIAVSAPQPAQEAAAAENAKPEATDEVTQGALRIEGEDGQFIECPLKHTNVRAEITGFIARVTVVQTFQNPTEEPIEAVYVFPLPNEAAVDDMTMVIGDRRIVGQIEKRDDARRIYEQAIASGQTASLLEQERPNIFTQSVGNIEPGEEINIEISYVDVLKYDMGTYEFHFPMVVGPRYNPSGPDRPVDADRIGAAPRIHPDKRTGHDISLSVELDAGVPIQDIKTVDHEVFVGQPSKRKASVSLSPRDTVPNKDFVLRYKVAGEKPAMAVLSHTGDYSHDAKRLGEGYFMLMIQPSEEQEEFKETPPREIVFLVDVSGSMRGEKTEQVKDCMRNMLGLCRDEDRFQVVTFAGQATKLFDAPVDVNDKTIREALAYNESSRSGGGTEMLRGIQMAMDEPLEDERMRIVVLLSDGFIGNEAQIIEHVGKKCGDQIRFWAVGVDASPNMFLIDGVARQGGGMGKRLAPNESAEPLTSEIMTRIQRAQLAKLEIEYGDLEVGQTYPLKLPELWAGRPVIVFGRYREGGDSTLTVRGKVEGRPVSWTVDVSLADEEPDNDVLAKTWARQKIESLMQQGFHLGSPAIEEEVTAIALNYRLMSPYTSFVAVDETKVADPAASPPPRVMVPVPLPAYNEWEGYFGESLRMADDVVELFEEESLESLSLSVRRVSPQSRASNESLSKRSQALYAFQSDGLGLGVDYRLPTLDAGIRFEAKGFARGGVSLASSISGRESLKELSYTDGYLAGGQGLDRRRRLPARPSGTEAILGTNVRGFGLERAQQLQKWEFGADEGADFLLTPSDQFGEGSPYQSISSEYYPPNVEVLLGVESANVVNEIEKVLSEAEKLAVEGRLFDARRSCRSACYLAIMAIRSDQDASDCLQRALKLQGQLREQIADVVKKQLPQVSNRLDLVITSANLDDALQMWSEASGIDVDLLDGSIEDVSLLLHDTNLRIDFADLRNVAAIESLEWLTGSFQLDYEVRDGAIVVGSGLRMNGPSMWIYNVAPFAIPATEEMEGLEGEELKSFLAKNAKEFVEHVKAASGASDDCRLSWYSTGELLVNATQADHRKLASLIERLSQDEPEVQGELQDWQTKIAERYATRIANQQVIDRQRRKLAIDASINGQAVELLCSASAGKLNLQALTHLQIAWAELASDIEQSETIGPRLHVSTWLICEAARALPDEAGIRELAEFAIGMTEPLAEKSLAALTSNPTNQTAYVSVLFASLARGLDDEFSISSRESLQEMEGDTVENYRTAFRSLAGEATDDDLAKLLAIVKTGPNDGYEGLLLTLACYGQQGELWEAFRRQSPRYLGSLDSDGNLIVFAERLSLGYIQVGQQN